MDMYRDGEGIDYESAAVFRVTKGLLKRFRKQIDGAVKTVAFAFELPQNGIAKEDVMAEAEALVMIYAGLVNSEVWGYNELEAWDNGDESETQAMLAAHLKRNLAQIISRKLVNEPDVVAYDPLIGSKTKEPHKEGWEKGKAAAMDNKEERKRVRAGFPTFARNVLDGITQPVIADELGISLRTVKYRIAAEKRAYLIDFVTRHGLRIEGDETIEELVEAYENLNKE